MLPNKPMQPASAPAARRGSAKTFDRLYSFLALPPGVRLMILRFLAPLLCLAAGCASGGASESALFLQSYSVADVVSDPAEAPRISTADFAQVVQDAAGIDAEGERVTAVAPGRIVARASAASHERIKQVLADFRRIQPR